jgi:ubiquinone/menaquinone biosynthesis C-methylase UbiE
VDFVAKAVTKARAKAQASNVAVNFAQADVTRLSSEDIGSNFGLIVDNGCLHGMSPEDRDAYVREVTAVAAPDARLLLVEFVTGGPTACRASTPMTSDGASPRVGRCCRQGTNRRMDYNGKNPARHYLFQRAS